MSDQCHEERSAASAPDMIEAGLPVTPTDLTYSDTSMTHLIFQIDEILRLIAECVGQVSKSAAVEFARCCRAFEEPALRPLWEDTTLVNLMYVLPKDVLCFGGPGLRLVGSLSHYLLAH